MPTFGGAAALGGPIAEGQLAAMLSGGSKRWVVCELLSVAAMCGLLVAERAVWPR